jgi:hypothetical protein
MRNETRIPRQSFALSGLVFALLTLLLVAAGNAYAQTFKDVCPHAAEGLFDGPHPTDRTFEHNWQKDYPMLIYSMSGVVKKLQLQKAAADAKTAKETAEANVRRNTTDANNDQLQKALVAATKVKTDADAVLTAFVSTGGRLYWKESNTKPDDALTQLPNPVFVPRVYTTEKLLVLVCRAHFGDSSDVGDTAVTVNVGDSGPESVTMKSATHSLGNDDDTIDRVYVLDPSKTTSNSIERVLITAKLDPTSSADTLATALIERHKVIHYSAGGGLLLIRGTQNTYTNITVPSVLATTNSVSSTTTTNGVITGTTSNVTTSTAAGTFTNVFGQRGSSIQVTDVAGATWYPFGRDTYPVTWKRGMAVPYGFYHPWRSLGVFLGTSVSSLGNFTAGPTYEPFLGIQLYAGTTWWNKNSLLPNVTACGGYGNSASFTVSPSSTNTTTTSTTASGTTTVTTTTTTISTSATSGCSNGDKATIVTGSTPPTQSNLKPAFSFGILFNSNLFKSFSGLK